MYDELVKRLRYRADREDDYYKHGGDIINEAADAIEELSERVPPVPHGRLIDADALDNTLGIDDRDDYVHWTLDDAPTIIPAEPPKDDSPAGTYDLLYEEGGPDA